MLHSYPFSADAPAVSIKLKSRENWRFLLSHSRVYPVRLLVLQRVTLQLIHTELNLPLLISIGFIPDYGPRQQTCKVAQIQDDSVILEQKD